MPLLTDPQAHGIAGPAFDVVIPSLPGYGFSDRSPSAGMTPRATAERVYLATREGWVEGESAYDELQSTKPQSLGYALNDYPAGLAGWMLGEVAVVERLRR